MTEGGRGAQQPLEATTLLPALRIQAAHTHTHHHDIVLGGRSQKRGWWAPPNAERQPHGEDHQSDDAKARGWEGCMVDASPSHACMGGGGELWETARLGRPRRREPAIDSPNASRAEKASKSQESRRRAASFLRHEARQSTPSLPTWFPSVRVWEKAGVGFDWPLGCLRLYPAKRFNGSDGSWLISRRWTCPGSPHLGAIPVRRETCLMDGIKSNKDAVISPLQAQHDATRGAHARSPLPASIKCRSPTWRVAQRRPPTTTQAKTTTDTE